MGSLAMFWQEFGILFVASLIGTAAVLPYGLRLLPKDKPLRFSKPVLYLLSTLQGAVLFAIVVGLGLLAAHAIGLGAPYIEALLGGTAFPASTGLLAGLVLGAIAGGVLLIGDLCFLPYWPQSLRETSLRTTLLENFLASFYGGINEELLMRLFGLSALAWLLLFVVHQMTIVLWISNIVLTIVFGLGHLPALRNVTGTISRAMFLRSLLLNAPIGLLCGWLFWTYGIEAAITAHFSADIVYHVFGTVVLRRKLSAAYRN
jgi:hypothetical protein